VVIITGFEKSSVDKSDVSKFLQFYKEAHDTPRIEIEEEQHRLSVIDELKSDFGKDGKLKTTQI
jgi:hypothetical protein